MESVPVLATEPGPGRSQVMDSLLNSLSWLELGVSAKSVERRNENKKRLALYGDGWKLKVYGDDSRIAFHHYGYMDKHEASMTKLPQLEPKQPQALDHSFINDYLGEHILLSKGEGFKAPMQQRIPEDARTYLGMMGFKVVVNCQGEVLRVEQPGAIDDKGD